MVADVFEKSLQRGPPLPERRCQQRLPGFAQQAIEDNEGCRRLDGEPGDAALGGVQPHLQRVEGEAALDRNDEFAVEHKGLGGEGPQVCKHLGKEAG
jgi:hypothetical protein